MRQNLLASGVLCVLLVETCPVAARWWSAVQTSQPSGRLQLLWQPARRCGELHTAVLQCLRPLGTASTSERVPGGVLAARCGAEGPALAHSAARVKPARRPRSSGGFSAPKFAGVLRLRGRRKGFQKGGWGGCGCMAMPRCAVHVYNMCSCRA